MKHIIASFLCVGFFAVTGAACGPSVSGDDHAADDDDTSSTIDAGHTVCNPTEANETSCDDGVDSDCDGWADCDDVDCSGVGTCPICGEAGNIEGQPVALPDDGTCTNNYTSVINITGFDAGQTLGPATNFKKVCVTMEHSWLRDLQINLSDPRGDVIELQHFLGSSCPATGACEIFMGVPNEADEGGAPIPGTGYTYCWTPTATNPPMLDYAATQPDGHLDLPAGDYSSVSGFSSLADTPLNGAWTIQVEDCWAIDNGFIFDWSIQFDDSLVNDCSHPIG
jgi:hypothetical protein